jgi:hypothetical protein
VLQPAAALNENWLPDMRLLARSSVCTRCGRTDVRPDRSTIRVATLRRFVRHRTCERFNKSSSGFGLRYDNWKFVFLEQRAPGQLLIWANPFTNLRVPKIFNLRTDPYERADVTSNTYYTNPLSG